MPRSAGARADGRIRIKLILGLAVVAVGVYAGSQAAYHYWAYWNLKEEAERAAIEVASKDGQEAAGRQMIQAKAKEYDLQFEDKEIQINTQSGMVTVAFAWERPIEFPGYTYTLAFQVNATTSRRR